MEKCRRSESPLRKTIESEATRWSSDGPEGHLSAGGSEADYDE